VLELKALIAVMGDFLVDDHLTGGLLGGLALAFLLLAAIEGAGPGLAVGFALDRGLTGTGLLAVGLATPALLALFAARLFDRLLVDQPGL